MLNNSFFLYLKKNEVLISFYLCMLIFFFGFLLLITDINIGFTNLHSYYYYLIIFLFIYFFFTNFINFLSYGLDDINSFFIILISFIFSFIALFIVHDIIFISYDNNDVTFLSNKHSLIKHQISHTTIDYSNNYISIIFEAINNIKCTLKETKIEDLYFYDLLPSNSKYNFRNYNVHILDGYHFDKKYFDLYPPKYCYCNLSDRNDFKFFYISMIEPIFSYDHVILGIDINLLLANIYCVIILFSFFVLLIYLLAGWYNYIYELLFDYFQRNYSLLFNLFSIFSFFYMIFFLNIIFNDFFYFFINYINNLIFVAFKLLNNLTAI
jgi:hypothetical protein